MGKSCTWKEKWHLLWDGGVLPLWNELLNNFKLCGSFSLSVGAYVKVRSQDIAYSLV